LIPVVRELVADTFTPVGAYLRLAQAGVPSFLLESAEGGERWGRYSVLGVRPRAKLSFVGGHWSREEAGRTEVLARQGLDGLRQELARSKPVEVPGLPRFAGGLVGYFGYDTVRWFERIPDRHVDARSPDFPEAMFFRVEDAIVFDNARQRALVVAWADVKRAASAKAAFDDAEARIDALTARLHSPLAESLLPAGQPLEAVPTPGGRAAYIKGVKRALEYIRAGDVFQVVLSQPFEVQAALSPVTLYRALRAVNPSPYLFLLDLGGPALVGSSPELLVRVERSGARHEVVVRPIAGTRRRGSDAEADKVLEKELREDPKERAEHVMLVDLGRNDVGRVSELGTVRVEDLMVVERYSHVMHLVSQVRGRLAKGKDSLDAFAAAFPAGTLSGAPKIRAMQVIDELEPARRGPYGGAIGSLSFFGELDLAIMIRSARVLKDRTILQAGAGIVADSDPAKEWDEVNAKIAAVLRAVQLAGGDRR
jgi:anthranilate synthase component 1